MRTVGLTFRVESNRRDTLRFRLQFSAPIGASRTSRESILEKERERLAREGENYSAKHEGNWCCKAGDAASLAAILCQLFRPSSYPISYPRIKQLSDQLSDQLYLKQLLYQPTAK